VKSDDKTISWQPSYWVAGLGVIPMTDQDIEDLETLAQIWHRNPKLFSLCSRILQPVTRDKSRT
jgi:hypothetical protein